MKQKKYWLRGIGVGIVLYILVIGTFVLSLLYGTITCNELITVGAPVDQSFLCPLIFVPAVPTWVFVEIGEDISQGDLNFDNIYFLALTLLGMLIYFGIFAYLGYKWGKNKNRRPTRN